MDSRRSEKGSAILRALSVLEGVAASERPLTSTELNETLALPKATVHRLVNTLVQEGYLQRKLDGKRLIPGPRLHRIALGVIANMRFRAQRHAILLRLSEEVGETCNIAVPDGSEMIYFDRVETHWPLRLQLPIGTRVPLHCTASGKLYLSTLTAAQRARLLAHLPLERRTPRTLTDPARLEAELARVRAEQVGTDDEEFLEGMVAVAVPVTDAKGRLYATLAMHAPTVRMSIEEARAQLATLRRAARELTALVEEDAGG